MATLEEKLNEFLNLPKGTTITDTHKINELVDLARNWTGTDESQISCLRAVLENFTKMRATAIDKLCREMKVKLELGCVPVRYEDFVQAYTDRRGVTFTLDRRLQVRGRDAADSDVFSRIQLTAGNLGIFSGRDCLNAAWRVWKTDTIERKTQEFRDRIAFRPDAPNDWDKVVRVLVAEDEATDDYLDLCQRVFMGAIWRIKNRMAGKPTRQHIMPYLRGRQGCGKSTFMDWLLGAVSEGVMRATFEMFEHDEKTQVLNHTPIIFFDEVAKADKADAAKVKNLMTSETTMYRKLYGEATKGTIISTFFGAGNLMLEEVFTDTTGLRRFFQIECRPDLYQHINALMAEIDPLALWQCVDENQPCPLSDDAVVERLKVVQGQHRNSTPVQEWLADMVARGGTGEFRESVALYDDFTSWRENRYSHDRTSVGQFQTQLGRILRDQAEAYPHDRKTDSATRRHMIRINALAPKGLVLDFTTGKAVGQ